MLYLTQRNSIVFRGALRAIKFYQNFISPLLGKHCRFYPSCSSYCYSAIKKNGINKGMCLSIKRILKCHPFNPGGIDLP